MKKLVLGLVVLVASVYAFAAPFGLTMGMTLDEITKACEGMEPQHIEKDYYYIYPQKKHELFETYIAFVDKKYGLYYLRAISKEIATEMYGTKLKEYFYTVNEKLSKAYGEEKKIDELDTNYSDTYVEDYKWFDSVVYGHRTFMAIWENVNHIQDNLRKVQTYVSVKSYPSRGWVVLEYEFANYKQMQNEQDSFF